MKTILKIHYPWSQLKKGNGFFVPCIDPEAVKLDGFRKALGHRVFDAKARVGVKAGQFGVWFYR